jgi:class 3 adenylate cyclase
MGFRFNVAIGASEDRLEKLIEERLRPGADKDRIDQRIWDLFGEHWCVMFTDLSGFSRGVARFGIIHFLQTIHESERLLLPIIEAHDGILLKVEGDSFLVIFRSAAKALACSVQMNRALHRYNREKAPEEQVLLCLGLGYGRVLRIGDRDVFGAEVNAASKLGEDTAKAYEILITEGVKAQLGPNPGFPFEELPEAPSGAEKAYRVGYPLE